MILATWARLISTTSRPHTRGFAALPVEPHVQIRVICVIGGFAFPDLERFAARMGADTTELDSSQVPMLSSPNSYSMSSDVIRKAPWRAEVRGCSEQHSEYSRD
jgi:hypothetical protein